MIFAAGLGGPIEDEFPEIMAATGAMLVGRRTDEVGDRMDANKERGAASSDEGYPFSGPVFVLTHKPPDPPALLPELPGDLLDHVLVPGDHDR